MKNQIIKFTDVNVDGCGTDVVEYIRVEGEYELTNGVIERTKKAIENYKEETEDWDTDGVIETACEHLETEGYVCHSVLPAYEIEF